MATAPRRLTFGAHAGEYERARPAWPAEAARWLVPEDAKLVVELGAGTGKLTRAMAALGVRVVAVEPDPRMLTVLRGHGLEGVEGSAESIPFGDAVADGVVAGSSLHWFELDLALPEIHRVLRPGGRFAFGWNHRDDRHPAIAGMGEAVYSAQARTRGPRWRSRDWADELNASGLFEDVEHALFEHVHELPRAALHDHLLSYSGVAALPGDERARVAREVAQVLDSDPSVHDGDTLRLPFVVAAYRARRAD
jgi:SAM-dependent methyltransferase